MPKLLQPSFGGGEYAPALYGRVDLQRYGISGKRFRNYIIRPTGGFDSRLGTTFVAPAKLGVTRAAVLLPFSVSEDVSYVVELGHLYARFYYRGAPVLDAGVPAEVATPWTDAEIGQVRITQSADSMFLVHRNHPPQVLRRTGASTFALSEFVPREGPFRSLNSDEALIVAASAATGTVVVTTNFDLFTANLVDSLLYMEPKALGNIRPWAQGERTGPQSTLAVGAMRRSDGKIYRATSLSIPSGTSAYVECGNVRPTHEIGKEWDGPGDVRVFDTINYRVGVEWEYVHSGYGIVQITGITDARTATAVVKKTLPPQVVGGIGAANNTWILSGDGTTRRFAIPGALSLAQANYTVDIGGAPTQSDPNYNPPGGNTGTTGSSQPGTHAYQP